MMGRIREDLTGNTYGRLTVTREVGGIWECACSCGGTAYVLASNLRSGNSTSCGCYRQEAARARALANNPLRARNYENTHIGLLQQKRRRTNKSGYKGVSWNKKRGKWVAYIGVDGKAKGLGSFDSAEDAAKARAAAEEIYYKPRISVHQAGGVLDREKAKTWI